MPFIRLFFLMLVLYSFPFPAAGQKRTVSGIVYEQGTPFRIGEVIVENKAAKLRVKTNYMGEFTIPGGPGDSLFIHKEGYADFSLPLKSSKNVVIQLIKMRQLAEVTITAPTKKEELDEVMEGYRKKGTYYMGRPPVLAYFFKPLTALYELIGRTPRQARRFQNYYVNELEQSEVDRRFNRVYVKSLTGLEETDLVNFMQRYRPDFTELSGWNEYDLMNYIRRSLTDFNEKGRPRAEALPDLRTIPVPAKE
ncbi:MAG TPA: hypothetical protein VGE15_08335 [Sphingobacteriaceae bacterium]